MKTYSSKKPLLEDMFGLVILKVGTAAKVTERPFQALAATASIQPLPFTSWQQLAKKKHEEKQLVTVGTSWQQTSSSPGTSS